MVHAELGKNFLFLDTETQAQKMLQFSASIIHKR
jgi:hypothetical protein